MPTANPSPMINGGWSAFAPGGRRKRFATYDEAVAWITANGGEIVVTEETRRFI